LIRESVRSPDQTPRAENGPCSSRGLNLKIPHLSDQKGAIALLSTLGLAISTLVVAGGTWLVLSFVGMPIPPVTALLFGALISPTDPIAVLAILRTLDIPTGIEAQIGGESLFNDGVGAVVFMVLLQIATSSIHVGALEVVKLFVMEAVGGNRLWLGRRTY